MNMPTTRPGLRFRPLVWALLLGCILTYPFSPAVSRPPGDKRDYILVINTYAESTPWSRGIIADITAHVEQIENLELYTEHMTLLLVDSPEDIRTSRRILLPRIRPKNLPGPGADRNPGCPVAQLHQQHMARYPDHRMCRNKDFHRAG